MSTRTARVLLDGVEYMVVEWAPTRSVALDRLTDAEREIAELVARGETNAAIAKIRKTSVRTVANQVGAVLRKLGAPSRVHVAGMFHGRARE